VIRLAKQCVGSAISGGSVVRQELHFIALLHIIEDAVSGAACTSRSSLLMSVLVIFEGAGALLD
jgi:hypothetical protein